MKTIFVEISIFDLEKLNAPFMPPFRYHFWISTSGSKKIGRSDINRCIKAFMKTAIEFKRKCIKENIWAIIAIEDTDGANTFKFKVELTAIDNDSKEVIESIIEEIPFRINSMSHSGFGTGDSLLSVSFSETKINELINKCIRNEKQSSGIGVSEAEDPRQEIIKPAIFNLPEKYHRKLKDYSAISGVSMKEIICIMIEKYCNVEKDCDYESDR